MQYLNISFISLEMPWTYDIIKSVRRHITTICYICYWVNYDSL